MSEPYVSAMVLADVVICDVFSDKWSLVGIFSKAWAHKFPVIIPRICCYACLSDVSGEINPSFRILDPDLNVVRQCPVPTLTARREDEQEIGCVFPEVLMARPGRYSVELLLDGCMVQSVRLDVVDVPTPIPEQ